MKDISVMIGEVKFNYRVGLLIENGNQVLVECNPKYDFVVIPGGRIKTLESSIMALQREIKEEMGININPHELKKKGLIENFFEFEGKRFHELLLVYKIKVKSKNNVFRNIINNLDSQDSYYKWIDKDKIDDVNLLPIELKLLIKSKRFEIIVTNN